MTSPHDTHSEYTRHPAVDSLAPRHGYSSPSTYRPEATTTNSQAKPVQQTEHMSTSPSRTNPSNGEAGRDSGATATQAGTATAPEKRAAAHLTLPPIQMNLPLEQRGAEVLRLAIEAFPQTDNWVIFYREILGVEGVARKLFTTIEELSAWESTPQFAEVHTMISALRSHDTGKGDTIETQRMITVRLPASLHEVLKKESEEQGLSINKLCITKLLHKMDSRFVPQEPGKRRGRKPGPQGKRAPKATS